MRIERCGTHHYCLSQRAYAEKVARENAEKYNWRPEVKAPPMPLGPSGESAFVKCEGAAPGSAGILFDAELDADDDKMRAHALRYASLLGSLMWLSTSTRPDLAFAISAAGRYTKLP